MLPISNSHLLCKVWWYHRCRVFGWLDKKLKVKQWFFQFFLNFHNTCEDCLVAEERPDDPQPRHNRLHHRSQSWGASIHGGWCCQCWWCFLFCWWLMAALSILFKDTTDPRVVVNILWQPQCIADICHNRHNRQWCTFFKPVAFSAQRMWNFGPSWLFFCCCKFCVLLQS